MQQSAKNIQEIRDTPFPINHFHYRTIPRTYQSLQKMLLQDKIITWSAIISDKTQECL